MATIDELDARLAELEARLGPVPTAVAPITIGELADVPTPGAPIASPWAQEVTHRIVQRFANKAALDAWAAQPGALAVTLDTGVLYRRVAAGWSRMTPQVFAQAGIGGALAANAVIATINIAADPGPRIGIITAHCSCVIGGAATNFNIEKDGSVLATFQYPASTLHSMVNMTSHVQIVAGNACVLKMYASQPVSTLVSLPFNVLECTVMPG